MEAEHDSGGIYEALKLSGRAEGVINPGDNMGRFSFDVSLSPLLYGKFDVGIPCREVIL
jgi:hypothetical protein